MYIFSPMQFEEFGGEFFNADAYAYRYILHERLFGLWKSIFIPFGPIIKNESGLKKFFEHIETSQYKKVTISLPLILDESVQKKLASLLQKYRYTREKYQILEDETLITFKDEYKPDSKTRYKIRKCLKTARVELYKNIKDSKLKQAYGIYEKFIKSIGKKPYKYALFEKMKDSGYLGLAYEKKSDDLLGFIYGFKFEMPVRGFLKNKKKANISQIWFSGVNDKGRDHLAGYALRDKLIKTAFSDGCDLVDSVGASRKWDESYLPFKKEFAHKFVALPGRFVKNKFKIL